MFDYHVHSKISFDSEAEPEEIIREARKKGLRELCFTDHMDFEGPVKHICFEYQKYRDTYVPLQEKYQDIAIKLGVEIGSEPGKFDQCNAFLQDKSFDFVICSQHVVRGDDPYFPSYFERYSREQGYRLYLEELLAGIMEFDQFDVVGHIGYVSKYYPGQNRKIDYPAELQDIVDEILKVVIQKGKGIEVNTSGIYQTGDFEPTKEIIARYIALGGEILTLGSDSHFPEVVGAYFDDAMAFLSAIGAKYLCTFTKRVPTFHKLSSLMR